MDSQNVSRRSFVKSAAALGLAAQALPLFNVRAQGAGKKFKVGLVGCGGRGAGSSARIHAVRRPDKVVKVALE